MDKFVVGGLVIAGGLNLLLGCAVLSRDWRVRSHRLFLLVTVCVALWSFGVAAFWNSNSEYVAHRYANGYYVAALGIGVGLYGFSIAWLKQRGLLRQMLILGAALAIYALSLRLNPTALIDSVTIGADNKLVRFNTPGLLGYTLAFLVLFVGALLRLGSGLRRAVGISKSQLEFMLAGLTGAGLIGIVFNLTLPWFGIYDYIWVGPMCSLIFVLFVGYAIARHKLFNFRRTLARAITYFLTITALLLVYFGALFSLSQLLLGEESLSLGERLFFVAFAMFSALFFQPLKRFFDTYTRRYFYKDGYNPNTFLDVLNSVLVRTVQLDRLLGQVARLIRNTLKASSTTFILVENKGRHKILRQVGGEKSQEVSRTSGLGRLVESLDGRHKQFFTQEADEIIDNSEQQLLTQMQDNDVDIAVKLKAQGQLIGYLLIGPHKSGHSYSSSDIQLIEIIADELAIAIQNAVSIEKVENFNLTLQQKINTATRQLKHSNEKLKALDAVKDEFISMASHQLRTPLTAAKGYVSMVIEGDAGKITPAQKELLSQAFASSQRMVNLIGDLLNVSRLKTGKFIIVRTAVNLAELIAVEITQLHISAESRNLKINYNKPASFPTLQLDEVKTRQVIMNFIDNAIYYTPADGQINIELVDKPTSVECRVTDNGIGVPKAEQHQLFTKFYRARNARGARPDGTGLGLYMARKIIVAQGGALLFKSPASTDPDRPGSSFGFTFPKPKP